MMELDELFVVVFLCSIDAVGHVLIGIKTLIYQVVQAFSWTSVDGLIQKRYHQEVLFRGSSQKKSCNPPKSELPALIQLEVLLAFLASDLRRSAESVNSCPSQ